jgi:hypothetical protein
MNALRRDWALLTVALVGAGIGQWVWLAKLGPFVLGLVCYLVALASWLRLQRAANPLPLTGRAVRFAWAGAVVFGTLAVFVGLRGPENTPLAVLLSAVALAYAAWAAHQGHVLTGYFKRARRWGGETALNARTNRAISAGTATAARWAKSNAIQAVLLCGSLLVIFGSGLAAHRGQRPSAHLMSLAAWGFGLLLFLLAFTPSDAPRRAYRGLMWLSTAHRREALILLALSVLAIALRTVNLGGVPAILAGDEAAMGLEAVKVLDGRQVNPFSTGWTSHPTLYFYNLALFLKLAGQSVAGLRLASALAGAFTVPITYLIARRSAGRTTATISALFLAGYHVHVHYSRLALNNVWAPLAAAATFLCLWEGLRSRQGWLFALGGVAMGLGQYTYFGARLIPIVVLVWLFFLAVTDGAGARSDHAGHLRSADGQVTLKGNSLHLGVFWIGFLLTLLPLSWFFVEHWNAFTGRVSQVGVFGSTGVDPTQAGVFAPLISGLAKSALAFNYVNDRSIFYGPSLPLLHWLSGLAFFFGLIQAGVHWRKPGNGLVLIWLLGTIVFGGALMNHPPESPRLLFAAPAVAILVALGLTEIAQQITRLSQKTFAGGQQWTGVGHLLAYALAVAATSISIVFYLAVYTPSNRFGDVKTHAAHHLGVWARGLEAGHQVFFFGAPVMTYRGFPSIAFLAPDADIHDVLEPIESPLPIKAASTFIFVPQRLEELDIIAAAHPDGRRWTELDSQGRLLFVAYEIVPDT